MNQVGKTKLTLVATFGGWSTASVIHLFHFDEETKLCDGKKTRYGTELGWQGGLDAVTCAKCKKKLTALRKDNEIEIVDGWLNE